MWFWHKIVLLKDVYSVWKVIFLYAFLLLFNLLDGVFDVKDEMIDVLDEVFEIKDQNFDVIHETFEG